MRPAICAVRIRSRRARVARRPASNCAVSSRAMQGSRPEERKRAMGDLQLEARQLADAERRLGNEASRTAPGTAGEDARRRLAAEQERLADRTQRLGESVKQLASGARSRKSARRCPRPDASSSARTSRAGCAKPRRRCGRASPVTRKPPASAAEDRAGARQGWRSTGRGQRRARRGILEVVGAALARAGAARSAESLAAIDG